jgi:hypothetical protein
LFQSKPCKKLAGLAVLQANTRIYAPDVPDRFSRKSEAFLVIPHRASRDFFYDIFLHEMQASDEEGKSKKAKGKSEAASRI